MDDSFDSDVTAGEDPVVRQAALDALGNMNGTVLAIEPTSGRVLAMVNQKLALSSGAQPCSTIKLSVALAALSEDLITKDTQIALGRRSRMNLTTALAHSNNAYFEALGRKLGFEKVSFYAHQFGLGELAGYNIAGEQLGTYPQQEISSKLGGVGKMCSFGEGISMTPLQLGAMVSAIANGGTLYYLQHPTTADEVANFEPRVKRHLDIAPLIPEISDGMAGGGQLRHRPQPAGQFQRRRNSGQDRHLLQGRHPLRMVCLLRQDRRRTHRGRRLPARRTPHLRTESRGDFRPHVSQSLRPRVLRRASHTADRYGEREAGGQHAVELSASAVSSSARASRERGLCFASTTPSCHPEPRFCGPKDLCILLQRRAVPSNATHRSAVGRSPPRRRRLRVPQVTSGSSALENRRGLPIQFHVPPYL